MLGIRIVWLVATAVGLLFAPAVTAAPTYSISVEKAGSGGGTIWSTPGSISCPGASCSDSFPSDTAVTLHVFPDNGSFFEGWSGACSGTAWTCVLPAGSSLTVTATFVKPTVSVRRALFEVAWRGGKAHGVLTVQGTSNVDATMFGTLTRPGAPAVVVPLAVKSGSFEAHGQLPLELSPGTYTLSVGGTVNGAYVVPDVLHGLMLQPSTDGRVSGAFFSLSPNGKKVTRVPVGATQLWVHIRFVSMPKGSPHLTVQWTKPDGTPATPKPAAVPLRKTIVTGIAIAGAADRGIWTVVLRNGDTIVFQTNIRAG